MDGRSTISQRELVRDKDTNVRYSRYCMSYKLGATRARKKSEVARRRGVHSSPEVVALRKHSSTPKLGGCRGHPYSQTTPYVLVFLSKREEIQMEMEKIKLVLVQQ